MTAKTRHCDECRHYSPSFAGMHCARGHHPRFYNPGHAHDTDYGWKRKCVDFQEKKQ